MQRSGDRWKIVAVKDDVLAGRIVDNLAKNLPAIGQEIEKQVRDQLDKKVPKDLKKSLPNIPGLTEDPKKEEQKKEEPKQDNANR